MSVVTYQVGFGDCYLLTFEYTGRTRNRHVLVDFGRTHKPDGRLAAQAPSLTAIAKDIEARVTSVPRGRLDVIVATHRHKDHIHGFGTNGSSSVLAGLNPNLVVQPWTEHPRLARTATRLPANLRSGRSFARALVEIDALAHAVRAVGDTRNLDSGLSDPVRSMYRELSFLGEDNISNKKAVKWLMSHGRRHEYLNHGRATHMNRLLPGVKVRVLGPPTLDQHPAAARMRSRDPDEYWHLHARAFSKAASNLRQHAARRANTRLPQEARWFAHRLEEVTARQLLSIARNMDGVLNNTSLILLFEAGNQRLLFPGDAQIENWSYALFHAPASQRRRTLAALKKVTFYKVGHHGSLNATPKTVWNQLDRRSRNRSRSGRLVTMLSTAPDVHGHAERDTEVPRSRLVRALERESDLIDTSAFSPGQLFDEKVLRVR
ncbi:MAG: hypothetical protein ACQGVC_19290 [Myxococcota bacterium]